MNIAIFPELPLALPRLIFAYIDPATTSYLIQIGVGIVIALGTAIGIFRSKIKKALKGKKNKITWDKVENADGYVVYVKYPGAKKYVKAVTRDATVKSVTHKGLSRNRVYRYKVRAYKRVSGKTYYGPFSRVKKAKAR